MKRNALVIAISTLLFSFFFYQQKAGINVLLFTISLLTVFLIDKPVRLKDTRWLIYAALSLVTGFFVAWHGTVISVMANVAALSVLAVHSLLPKSSFFPSILYALYSYISSFIYFIIDLTEAKPKPVIVEVSEGETAKKPKLETGAKLVIGIIGLAVIVVFVFLYRKANPVFKEFTDNINLDFISTRWLAFTFLGFLLMYGFFFIRHIPGLFKKDTTEPANLNRNTVLAKENMFLGFKMDAFTEGVIVMVFLGILNLILLLLNVLDISFLTNGSNLPTDVTYSDYVHRGVGTLIVSVIFVILIVMYFFRGALNFYEKSSSVRLLTTIWLAQNVIMLASTAYRNAIYISEYSLTYRRIGVYVWLLLTAVGIISTIYKVSGKRSAWYLIRTNGWAFFTAILLLGTVNWDVMIARYNSRDVNNVDYEYLMRMNNNALPYIYSAAQTSDPGKSFDFDNDFHTNRFELLLLKDDIDDKIIEFRHKYENQSWKSWNFDDMETYQLLK